MSLPAAFALDLPDWVIQRVTGHTGPLLTEDAAMALAIALSRENVERGAGGPFGAVVYDPATGELISAGVNLVTESGISLAHAEMVALSLAQSGEGSWDLATRRPLSLVTSCEPCAMCHGGVLWSGVRALVCGARKEDAEAVGFDEGDKPDSWVAGLTARGITVTLDVLREEAAEVFALYGRMGGEIYNPKGVLT